MDTQAWIDQVNASLTTTIRRCGWAIQYVGGEVCSRPGCECQPGTGPPFAYTIGLFGLGHPELLIFGLGPAAAAAVLNRLCERIRREENFLPGQMLEVEGWPHRIIPEEVPNPGEILFSTNDYYQRPSEFSVPALQLSYDDGRGRFPWDVGFATPEAQPRPGSFSA
jgi:hypothetical protein